MPKLLHYLTVIAALGGYQLCGAVPVPADELARSASEFGDSANTIALRSSADVTGAINTGGPLVKRFPYSTRFAVPKQSRGASPPNYMRYVVGQLAFEIAVNVYGTVTWSVENLSNRVLAWALYDNTAVAVQSGNVAGGATVFFDVGSSAPGNVGEIFVQNPAG